jgi:hypothetical protein
MPHHTFPLITEVRVVRRVNVNLLRMAIRGLRVISESARQEIGIFRFCLGSLPRFCIKSLHFRIELERGDGHLNGKVSRSFELIDGHHA